MHILLVITTASGNKESKIIQANSLQEVEAMVNRYVIKGTYTLEDVSSWTDLSGLRLHLEDLSETEEI